MKYSPAQVRQPVQAPTYKPSVSAFPVYAPAKALPPASLAYPRALPAISLPNPSITPVPFSPQASAIQAQIDALRPNVASPEDVAKFNDLTRQRNDVQRHYEQQIRHIPPVMVALSEAIDRMVGLLQRARRQHAGLLRATEHFRTTMPRALLTAHVLATEGPLRHLQERADHVRALAHEVTPLSAPRALEGAQNVQVGLHRLLEEMEVLYHQTGHAGPVPEAISLSGAEIAPTAPDHSWRDYVKPALIGLALAFLVSSLGGKAR